MKIRRSHNLGVASARDRADRIAADLKRQFSLRSEWRGDTMHVTGNGLDGRLQVDDTHLELDIRLGFALKLMEAPIRSAIEKAIDEELA